MNKTLTAFGFHIILFLWFIIMGFRVKMDDKKIKVDIEKTNVKDILQYCKPKEQLVLFKKFGLTTGKEIPLQKIGEVY